MNRVTDYLFDSAYQIITWVCIAVAIGGIFYFLSKDNSRGVMWSAVALTCSIVFMLGIIADRHFFHNVVKSEQVLTRNDFQTANREDFQNSQAAQLILDEFRATVTLKPEADSAIVDYALTITNAGPTVAREISIVFYEIKIEGGLMPLKRPEPSPAPQGRSLVSNKFFQHRDHLQLVDWSAITQRKRFYVFRWLISYRDVFGRDHIFTPCVYYDVGMKQFLAYPYPDEPEDRDQQKKQN